MAKTMLPNELYTDKSKDAELIYYGAVICQILDELESYLYTFRDDPLVSLLSSVKYRFISSFYLRKGMFREGVQ